MWKIRNDAYINTTKISSVRVLACFGQIHVCPLLLVLPSYLEKLIGFPWASWLKGQTCALKGHLPSFCCPVVLTAWSSLKNVAAAFFPLVLSFIWSRIWVSFSTNSPTLLQFLNGQPSLKAGQLPARPLHLVTRMAYGHTPLPNAGHVNIVSLKVTL